MVSIHHFIIIIIIIIIINIIIINIIIIIMIFCNCLLAISTVSFFTGYFLTGIDSVTEQKGCFHRGPHLGDHFCSNIM